MAGLRDCTDAAHVTGHWIPRSKGQHGPIIASRFYAVFSTLGRCQVQIKSVFEQS